MVTVLLWKRLSGSFTVIAVQTDCFGRQIKSLLFLKEQFHQFFCGLVCVAEYDGVRVDFSDSLLHFQPPEDLT